jgi:dTDP-4-dehydrorhamnose 3,5-epimerase
MIFEELTISGAWKATSIKYKDHRGSFSEWFKSDELSAVAGFQFNVKQGNVSFSNKGTVRGIHYSLATSGQDKWVKCMVGSIVDFIIDIRQESPTFGKWISVELNANDNLSLLVSSGLGHAFVALEDNSCVSYLLTSAYSPSEEFGINPLDQTLALDWRIPKDELLISKKDREAPTFKTRILNKSLPIFKEM